MVRAHSPLVFALAMCAAFLGGSRPATAQGLSLVDQFESSIQQWKQAAKDAILARQEYVLCESHQAGDVLDRWERAVAVGRDQYRRALDLAQKVIAQTPEQLTPDMAALFGAAIETSYESGDYVEAGELCDLVLASSDEPPPSILAHRVLIAFALNDFETSKTRLEQLEQLGLPLTEQLQSIEKNTDPLIAAWSQERQRRADEAQRDDLPRVRLVCDVEGDNEVVIELFEDSAPRNVANFIELVKRGFFDNMTFYQVITHISARSGAGSGDGAEEPEYYVLGEANAPQARHSFRGAVAMASTNDQNVHGTQFYIALSPSIDNSVNATIIGRVISGMDVISRLNMTHISNKEKQTFDRIEGVPPTRILKAEVLRDRGHPYEAEKIQNPLAD